MRDKNEKTIRVVCAIIECERQILLTQRSEQMSQPLLWEFPGGKVEPGETEKDCLEREILEELNISILPKRRLTPVYHTYPTFSIELIPYICTFQSGTICLLEHSCYEWVPKDKLMNYQWCPADLPIVKEYVQLHR